jgi:hypothetical protein
MSTISLTYPHHMTAAAVKEKIDNLFTSLESKSDYFEQVDIIWSDDQRECSFSGEGFSGRFQLRDGVVDIEARLEGMMSMFRPVVEQKLKEYLDQFLGEGS